MSNDTQIAALMALVDFYADAEHWSDRHGAAKARAAVEASARQLAERPGVVMVPLEPTPEMVRAAYADWFDENCDATVYNIWHAMLAAAPTTEATSSPSDAERYRLVRRGQHWSVIDGIGNVLRGDDLDAAIDAAIRATKGGEL